jgi:hypothetical protein
MPALASLEKPATREVTMKMAAIATGTALLLACTFAAQAQEKVSDGVVKIGMIEVIASRPLGRGR